MSRTKYASFTRAYEYERGFEAENPAPSSCPAWLDSFARQLAVKESKTAVEVARERNQQSIYQQMSALISNPTGSSKFSSVDEIVEDYQNRTGLSEYLKKIQSAPKKDIKTIASQIIEASEKKEADSKKKI